MKIKRTLSLWAAAAAAALVLSGCGSPDPHEPAELQDYRELVQIKEDWTAGVGESLTGLLTPAVTERGIYAAGDRSVYLLDPATGKKLWATETESEITGCGHRRASCGRGYRLG